MRNGLMKTLANSITHNTQWEGDWVSSRVMFFFFLFFKNLNLIFIFLEKNINNFWGAVKLLISDTWKNLEKLNLFILSKLNFPKKHFLENLLEKNAHLSPCWRSETTKHYSFHLVSGVGFQKTLEPPKDPLVPPGFFSLPKPQELGSFHEIQAILIYRTPVFFDFWTP